MRMFFRGGCGGGTRFMPICWLFTCHLTLASSSRLLQTPKPTFHKIISEPAIASLSTSTTLLKQTDQVLTTAASGVLNKKMDSAAAETYESGTNSVAFVTTPDENSAKKLARGIIEQNLAACVNIIPQIQSIYMWEGKINEDSEYLMMIKTSTALVDKLSLWVREHHPYSVAEVISLPIQNGNEPYLHWITQTLKAKEANK